MWNSDQVRLSYNFEGDGFVDKMELIDLSEWLIDKWSIKG